MLRAANSIADSKHADQPAAIRCSGLVPVPGLPGRDSLTSRRPSELRDMPARPPVVWAFAVYSTFSSRFITSSFMKSPGALRSSVAIGIDVVRRPQIGGTRQADRSLRGLEDHHRANGSSAAP